MTELEIPKGVSVKGLLKKIVGYETNYNSTNLSNGHSVSRIEITTRLEILSDDGKIIPIHFQSYVGYELINQRVTYNSDNEVTTGNVPTAGEARFVRQDITRQKLIPDDENLPEYFASSCVYQG